MPSRLSAVQARRRPTGTPAPERPPRRSCLGQNAIFITSGSRRTLTAAYRVFRDVPIHTPCFHSNERIAPLNRGVKHLGGLHLDTLSKAEQYLEEAGLADRPGAVLYSSHVTLKPGPVYLLGLNPGGGEGATLRDSINASRRGNNAYLDEEWAPGGHLQPRGASTLQRRVQALCGVMGVETRHTPASNLAFTRSTGLAAHPGYAGAVELCAPVHKLFMDVIQPLFLMTFGSLSHFASGVKITRVESRDARHGTWKAHRGTAVAFGHEVAFGNVPHMSLWASDSREDVVRWAVAGLENQ